MSDPRIQTEEPWEPAFEDGAFHIEVVSDSNRESGLYRESGLWGVYDAYDNRIRLWFYTDTEAIDATVALALAAAESAEALAAEYERLLPLAQRSLKAAYGL
jgi:hypothetical protein